MKHQASISKLQRNSKFQAPTSRLEGCLKFGALAFSGAWSLDVGAFEMKGFN
jgi:hypothetical protein